MAARIDACWSTDSCEQFVYWSTGTCKQFGFLFEVHMLITLSNRIALMLRIAAHWTTDFCRQFGFYYFI